MPDVAEQHVRFLHFIECRIEGVGDRFFHQTFAQTDPQIAGQDLDDILSFARREFREAIAQKFGFVQRSARFLQIIEKLARFENAERFR